MSLSVERKDFSRDEISLLDLPGALLGRIVRYLNREDKNAFILVCRGWRIAFEKMRCEEACVDLVAEMRLGERYWIELKGPGGRLLCQIYKDPDGDGLFLWER